MIQVDRLDKHRAMAVEIAEVMNNTSSVLHYFNQETGIQFDVAPTSKKNRDEGYISTSPYNPDFVPPRDTHNVIVIKSDHGNSFVVCHDYYRFNVTSGTYGERWTEDFTNGAGYVMKVDDNGVEFIKSEPGLRAGPNGLVFLKGMPAFSDVLAIKF